MEFFAKNTLDPPHWTLNSSIGLFRTVWVHLGFISLLHEAQCKTGLTCAINAKVRATKSHRKFQMNAPDPPLWTLNSCFGASYSVRVHFGLFHYCTKLVAKRVELVQKFVPRSRIRIFCNECTRSTPLGPKLMFLVHLVVFGRILDCFVNARCLIQNGLNWCN